MEDMTDRFLAGMLDRACQGADHASALCCCFCIVCKKKKLYTCHEKLFCEETSSVRKLEPAAAATAAAAADRGAGMAVECWEGRQQHVNDKGLITKIKSYSCWFLITNRTESKTAITLPRNSLFSVCLCEPTSDLTIPASLHTFQKVLAWPPAQ
jgi:hypothetical protein